MENRANCLSLPLLIITLINNNVMNMMKNKTVLNRCLLVALFCLGLPFTQVSAQNEKNPDWGGLGRYAKENAALPRPAKNEKRVVFMGNSITEGWVRTHPDFFKSHGYIGRGISGQTSYQFLLRFRPDVINLSPALVIINAATNDIAENTGAYNEDTTFGNLVSMVELAKANGIKVILTSTLPAAAFGWRPSITDAPQKIKSLNARVGAYAKANKIPFVDYYSPLLAADGKSLDGRFSKDGVHPTSEGYDIMEVLIQKEIEKILR